MGFKKITYSLPALKTLLETKNSCVLCIQNCKRSLTILPAKLGNLKNSVNEVLSSKVTTCDPELKGIILSYKNVKIIDSVQLNDDGNYRLDYIADTYIFKPVVGNLLTGVVNKKCADHLGVLVHSVFNATIPKPRTENRLKVWPGTGVKIGQQVTFEVTKLNFLSRLPYIKGKLVDVDDKYNEDGDSGIGGHESTEESCITRSISEKHTDFNEISKKKKKKKRSASGEIFNNNDLENVFSDRSCSPGKKNSSNLSEIESLLLNEAITNASSSVDGNAGHEKNASASFSPNSSDKLPTGAESNKISDKKRKRESSITLGSPTVHHSNSGDSSSFMNYSSNLHDGNLKVKRKKLSKDINSETSPIAQENIGLEIAEEEKEIKKKKKKTMDMSIDEAETLQACHSLTEPDMQSTIDNLLGITTGSTKHKKKKKKKSSIHNDELSLSLTSSNNVDTTLDNDECNEFDSSEYKKKKRSLENLEKLDGLDRRVSILDASLRLSLPSDNKFSSEADNMRKKKKKKSKALPAYENNEESSDQTSDTASYISEVSVSDVHRKHKKKEKKKEKSSIHEMEFLQMENDCIAELLSSAQSAKANENDITLPSTEKKKKKKKLSTGVLEAPLLQSDDIRYPEMPPPSSTQIKKKKSLIFTD